MARRYPWVAPVVGLVVAVPVAAYGLLFTDEVLPAVLTALVVLLPFAVHGAYFARDPARVVPPRYLLAAAGTLAALVLLVGVAEGNVTLGAFVGLVAVVPALAYADRFGDGPLAPRPVAVGAGALVALSVLAFGALVEGRGLLAVANAVLVLAGAGLAADDGGSDAGGAEPVEADAGTAGRTE